ncbi:MAG: hypothetical protein F4Z33_10015, partial [Gemmatimonadales bacterium]|nr:hypothetical protein [Gemmatimonadales bacterium]
MLAAVLLAGAVAPRHAMAQTSPVVTVTLASTGTHALPGFNTNPSENGGVITVTAKLDRPAVGAVSIAFTADTANYNYPLNFARADSYTMSEDTVLTFAAGDTLSTGVVQISATNNEADEITLKRIRVTGTVTSGDAVFQWFIPPIYRASSYWEFLIEDDDPQPTATVVATPPEIAENGGMTTVTATLSNPTWRGDLSLEVETGFLPADEPNRGDTSDVVLSDSVRLVVPEGMLQSTGTVTLTAVD